MELSFAMSYLGHYVKNFAKLCSGLTGATLVFGFVRSLMLFNVLVRCAQTLHNRMFNAILRTHVRFFDVNPIGEQRG